MKFKVVRTTGPYGLFKGTEDLQKAFDEGWEYRTSSSYIEEHDDKSGYIEYILYKDDKETRNDTRVEYGLPPIMHDPDTRRGAL